MAWPFRSAKILSLLLFSSSASAASLDAYLSNRAGLNHFKDKQYFQSYQDFLKALEKEPLNPDLQMNLGATFVANEEWDKAEKAFMAAYAMSKGDSSREFLALFNLAYSRWQKSDIDKALEAYQKCLEIEPESLEVKTDIELMWQSQQGKGDGKKQDQKGGQGQDDKNKDQKDQDGKNDQKNKDRPYENGKKQQPKPFDSKDLSKEDVRKILNEISNQEQSIRAKEFDKGAKEHTYDKDW
jgi:tetratricopeptide (TPR) repeat protein